MLTLLGKKNRKDLKEVCLGKDMRLKNVLKVVAKDTKGNLNRKPGFSLIGLIIRKQV